MGIGGRLTCLREASPRSVRCRAGRSAVDRARRRGHGLVGAHEAVAVLDMDAELLSTVELIRAQVPA